MCSALGVRSYSTLPHTLTHTHSHTHSHTHTHTRTIHVAFAAAITEDKFPRVHRYISRMLQDPAVKKTALPPEKHLAFYTSAKEEKHDYSVADLDGNGVTIYTKKQD